ncbi:AAA family ATPase [Corynebacterium sp. H127]|uniref:AAA family ATPase n=1 Tax=Corynebacterium sp. H127 TaxID=3133418 RepID=UPI0030B6FE59
MNLQNQTAFQRFLSHAKEHGLPISEVCPGAIAQFEFRASDGSKEPGRVVYNGSRIWIHTRNVSVHTLLKFLRLDQDNLYDAPTGTCHHYPDGRIVHRSPAGQVRETGRSSGNQAYGSDALVQRGEVYIVTNEQDVDTIRYIWSANALCPAPMIANQRIKTDWHPIAGRQVVVVAEKSDQGQHAAQMIVESLRGFPLPPSSIRIVEPSHGRYISDHIAAGSPPQSLTQVQTIRMGRSIDLVPASKVKTERLEWLVENWIPKRSLTLLAGREGLGKSTIACALAAQATRGELGGRPLNVAYLNTEDSRAITVKPRLQAAGADLERVFFIDVAGNDGKPSSLKLPEDIDVLETSFIDGDVRFVVLDAAKSVMSPKLDGYRDDDVRQFLEPLTAMAERNDIAVLGLAHFGKRESTDPGKLLLGSIAWSQIARSVLAVATGPDNTLVVTNTKGNLASATTSREVRLESVTIRTSDGETTEVGRAVWGSTTSLSASDLLVDAEDTDELNELHAFLVEFFQHNPEAPRTVVIDAAQKERLGSESTIRRAFKKLGGKSERKGFPAKAVWSIDTK